jgi:hypothetical protein
MRAAMPRRALCSLLFCLLSLLITGCETTGLSPQQAMAVEARHRQIALEPRGDYYIGRRFYIDHTHLWGYLRSPGQDWETSRLVIMNERYQKIPYRLPEQPSDGGYAYGDDHNNEYRIWGRYTGRRVFDPNSNMILPEFELRRWEIQREPRLALQPNERFNWQAPAQRARLGAIKA